MIRFKQFISENYIKGFSEFLPNGARILFNHHGNHAYKTLDSAEYKKLKHYKQHYTEDTDTSINDWLTEAKNNNEHIPGNTHFDKMKTMEDEYNLSNEHKPAIKQYTFMSSGLNQHLIQSHLKNKKPINDFQGHDIKSLDETFIPSKHKIHLYSGGRDIRESEPVSKTPDGYNVYHNPGFISSSIDPKVAQFFANKAAKKGEDKHILHIQTQPDDPIRPVGKYSDIESEKEFLIPRTEGQANRPHLVHYGTKSYMNKDGTKTHIHHLGYISPKNKS